MMNKLQKMKRGGEMGRQVGVGAAVDMKGEEEMTRGLQEGLSAGQARGDGAGYGFMRDNDKDTEMYRELEPTAAMESRYPSSNLRNTNTSYSPAARHHTSTLPRAIMGEPERRTGYGGTYLTKSTAGVEGFSPIHDGRESQQDRHLGFERTIAAPYQYHSPNTQYFPDNDTNEGAPLSTYTSALPRTTPVQFATALGHAIDLDLKGELMPPRLLPRQEAKATPPRAPSSYLQNHNHPNETIISSLDPSFTLRERITAHLDLEILRKNEELRRAQTELAKCTIGLEQLRRIHLLGIDKLGGVVWGDDLLVQEEFLVVGEGRNEGMRLRGRVVRR